MTVDLFIFFTIYEVQNAGNVTNFQNMTNSVKFMQQMPSTENGNVFATNTHRSRSVWQCELCGWLAAVCEQRCMNAGYCSAPNQCTCALGYVGKYCQIRKYVYCTVSPEHHPIPKYSVNTAHFSGSGRAFGRTRAFVLQRKWPLKTEWSPAYGELTARGVSKQNTALSGGGAELQYWIPQLPSENGVAKTAITWAARPRGPGGQLTPIFSTTLSTCGVWMTPTFCQLIRLWPPLFVTVRGLCAIMCMWCIAMEVARLKLDWRTLCYLL